MMIFVDADACPVTRIVEKLAKQYAVPVTLLCDTNHVLTSDYSTIRIVGAGADAVDIALINLCQRGDIVVTQDYGVAALALGKGAKAIQKARRSAKNHLKGPPKRTKEDDMRFAESFERMIQSAQSKQNEV